MVRKLKADFITPPVPVPPTAHAPRSTWALSSSSLLSTITGNSPRHSSPTWNAQEGVAGSRQGSARAKGAPTPHSRRWEPRSLPTPILAPGHGGGGQPDLVVQEETEAVSGAGSPLRPRFPRMVGVGTARVHRRRPPPARGAFQQPRAGSGPQSGYTQPCGHSLDKPLPICSVRISTGKTQGPPSPGALLIVF